MKEETEELDNKPQDEQEMKGTIYNLVADFLMEKGYLKWIDCKKIPERYQKLGFRYMTDDEEKASPNVRGLYQQEMDLNEPNGEKELITLRRPKTLEEQRFILHDATHEYMHFFSHNRNGSKCRYLNEGITESLALDATYERALKRGVQPEYKESGYMENVTIVNFLHMLYGDELYEDYFKGYDSTLTIMERAINTHFRIKNTDNDYSFGDLRNTFEERFNGLENYVEGVTEEFDENKNYEKLMSYLSIIYLDKVEERALRGNFCGLNKDGEITLANLQSIIAPVQVLNVGFCKNDDADKLLEQGIKTVIRAMPVIDELEDGKEEKVDEIYSSISKKIEESGKNIDKDLYESPSVIEGERYTSLEFVLKLFKEMELSCKNFTSNLEFFKIASDLCSNLGISLKDNAEAITEKRFFYNKELSEKAKKFILSGNKLETMLRFSRVSDFLTFHPTVFRVSPDLYFCDMNEYNKFVIKESEDGNFHYLCTQPGKDVTSNEDLLIEREKETLGLDGIKRSDFLIKEKDGKEYYIRIGKDSLPFLEVPGTTPFLKRGFNLDGWLNIELDKDEIEAFKERVKSGEFNSSNRDDGEIDIKGFAAGCKELDNMTPSVLQEGLDILLQKEYGPFYDFKEFNDVTAFNLKHKAYRDISNEIYYSFFDSEKMENLDVSESLDVLKSLRDKQQRYYDTLNPKVEESKDKSAKEGILTQVVDLSGKVSPAVYASIGEKIKSDTAKSKENPNAIKDAKDKTGEEIGE